MLGALRITVLPAYAGMIRFRSFTPYASPCAPRIRGDDPDTKDFYALHS